MPSVSLLPIAPAVSPGGAASEYQIDFVAGYYRPRILSFLYTAFEIFHVNASYLIGKILPYKYGGYVGDVYKKHHNGAKAMKVNPPQMIKRMIMRWTGKKL